MPSARRIQWAEVRVVVVAVAALAILSVLVSLLSGGSWFKAKTELRTYLPDTSGLEPNVDVELNGVLIGKIESLQLTNSKDPNRAVEVRMRVLESFRQQIPDDSVTGLESENLLGDQFINITMGHSSRPVPPGGEVRHRPPTNVMQNIDLTQFAAQLKIIDQTIGDIQEGKGNLGEFYATDTMYRNVLGAVRKVESKLAAASDTQSQLGQFLYRADGYDQMQAPFRTLDDRLAKLQASPYLRDSTQYENLRDQIRKVRSALPGGKFFTSGADYEQWNRQVAVLINSVDSLANGPLLNDASGYATWNGKLRDLATFLKEFRQDPQKYLRIQLRNRSKPPQRNASHKGTANAPSP